MRDLLVSMITPGKDGTAETTLTYTRDSWGDGSQSCNCAVYAETFIPGPAGGSANPHPGSEDGACDSPIDYPPYPERGVFGFWRFQWVNDLPIAEYIDRDPGHLLDGEMVEFGTMECTKLQPDANGMLAPVAANVVQPGA